MEKLNLPLYHSGKVRDTYVLPDHPALLLVVASDRLSTHNVTHISEVPGKGELLTALTIFWHTGPLRGIHNHIVAYGFKVLDYLPLGHWPEDLILRGLVVRKLTVEPVEFVRRNRLAGSLYKDYKQGKDPYGLRLPQGLKKMHRFGLPVFTPTEKSATDDPLPSSRVESEHPDACTLTSVVFSLMSGYLWSRGIELVDSKFEVGFLRGDRRPYLADEFGTGDSSRFARIKDVREGEDPPWLDKQVFREEAERVWGGTSGPPLEFSPDVIKLGVQRYLEAFEAITGTTLAAFQAEHMPNLLDQTKQSIL